MTRNKWLLRLSISAVLSLLIFVILTIVFRGENRTGFILIVIYIFAYSSWLSLLGILAINIYYNWVLSAEDFILWEESQQIFVIGFSSRDFWLRFASKEGYQLYSRLRSIAGICAVLFALYLATSGLIRVK